MRSGRGGARGVAFGELALGGFCGGVGEVGVEVLGRWGGGWKCSCGCGLS